MAHLKSDSCNLALARLCDKDIEDIKMKTKLQKALNPTKKIKKLDYIHEIDNCLVIAKCLKKKQLEILQKEQDKINDQDEHLKEFQKIVKDMEQ